MILLGSEHIKEEADCLVHHHGTRDPFQIAKALGIHVIFDYDFQELKGMYKVILQSRFIFINGNMSSRDKRTVCAHELGHDRFHQHFAKSGILQEFMLYDMKSRMEYEANIFAAEFLIDDDDVLELVKEEQDICYIAGEMDEDMNLVLIKIDEMRKRGYDLRVPYRPQSDFLSRN